jgi:hypothetical protein
MNAGRLVVLCGAGLSMAAPSNLPSARAVAERCFDKYRLESDPNLDPALRQDLEALAEHFAGQHTLSSVFIEHLVPWPDFVRQSNAGHAAVADFLITRAAFAGLSSNYDTLIERQAWDYGADFRASLDGVQANVAAVRQGPLLKFHGCAQLDRPATVWTRFQFDDPVVSGRIERTKVWIKANLRQKDLLVVGFWSDWDYLNSLLDEALVGMAPLSVTVVDLSPANVLEQKAPRLWEIAHSTNVTFEHVQESGAAALDELRAAFSTNYMRQVLDAGRAVFEETRGAPPEPALLDIGTLDSETLYGWRRDAEGAPATRPATRIRPGDCEALGLFHLLLRHAGALQRGANYELNGRRVRVINGAGAVLNSLKQRFNEPPAFVEAEIVVAVGAVDLGVPENIVRSGRPADVIRPSSRARWLVLDGARAELNI